MDRFKLIAFVLSASLAGLASATKAMVFQLASLTDVTWQMSGEVVLMTLVGGLGTVFGPIVGAGIIITSSPCCCAGAVSSARFSPWPIAWAASGRARPKASAPPAPSQLNRCGVGHFTR